MTYDTTSLEVPPPPLTEKQLLKIHLHVGHCSGNTLITLLRAGNRVVPYQAIMLMCDKCKCHAAVRRITPPAISSWQYKYNGEVVGVDIVYPF